MKAPVITDHALIRYIERVLEIDIEGLRASIGDELTSCCDAAQTIGGEYKIIAGPVEYICCGGRVITVVVRR